MGVEDSARIKKLRENILRPPQVCIERGYLWTESYKETESEPAVIRRAKALEKVLKGMTVHIEDGELIVGMATSKTRGGPLLPEFQWEWYLKEIDGLSTREWDRFSPLTEKDNTKMEEFLPYWRGKTLYEKWRSIMPESALKLHNRIELLGVCCGANQHFCHIAPDYEMVLARGLNGISKHVVEEQAKLNLAHMQDFNKSQFLKAVDITLKAVIAFAERYADLARNLASAEKNSERKAELERIAETCERVPAEPARTFQEALQSVWFTYIVLMIEGWGNGIAFGRADQYLYPFYKKDIDKGRVTGEEARELIALLYIKMNGLLILQGKESVKFGAGFPSWPNVTLGGLTKDGKDAVNELSYLFLDAEKDVRLSSEELVIRIHKNTPDAFLMRACEVAKLSRGKLKFVSDKTAIQQLLIDGKPLEYARDYVLTGCNSPTVAGRSYDLPGALSNLPLMLELALNDGSSRVTGEQMGPKTG
ncbi:pyruvate formate lyase family protein, partial [Deltaproteobacteria bacterium]|nr:pyruvate formate lyase family protein [Deltaproteobacteria bacterium]